MILIVTSCGNREEADRIATTLVEERLAACVQILPATSVYRWQGAVERSEEWVLHIKTRTALADRIEARVKSLNGYKLPELIALPVQMGSVDYIAWVNEETEA